MEVVIDASAIIAVIANEPVKVRLIQVTQGVDLIAPASVEWEIGNAFSAMFKRHRISLAQALQAIESYRAIPIRVVEIELEEAVRLAQQLDLYAYDAYLLRCAQRYRASLLTLDRALAVKASALGIQITETSP